jgi:hypothetical protein
VTRLEAASDGDEFQDWPQSVLEDQPHSRSDMTAAYTFDVSSLDGYGSHNGDRGGYWGEQGQTGQRPVFEGAADFDLELVEQRTLDGRTQELNYRPTLH